MLFFFSLAVYRRVLPLFVGLLLCFAAGTWEMSLVRSTTNPSGDLSEECVGSKEELLLQHLTPGGQLGGGGRKRDSVPEPNSWSLGFAIPASLPSWVVGQHLKPRAWEICPRFPVPISILTVQLGGGAVRESQRELVTVIPHLHPYNLFPRLGTAQFGEKTGGRVSTAAPLLDQSSSGRGTLEQSPQPLLHTG